MRKRICIISFSPLEREDQLGWRLFYSPMIRYILERD